MKVSSVIESQVVVWISGDAFFDELNCFGELWLLRLPTWFLGGAKAGITCGDWWESRDDLDVTRDLNFLQELFEVFQDLTHKRWHELADISASGTSIVRLSSTIRQLSGRIRRLKRIHRMLSMERTYQAHNSRIAQSALEQSSCTLLSLIRHMMGWKWAEGMGWRILETLVYSEDVPEWSGQMIQKTLSWQHGDWNAWIQKTWRIQKQWWKREWTVRRHGQRGKNGHSRWRRGRIAARGMSRCSRISWLFRRFGRAVGTVWWWRAPGK